MDEKGYSVSEAVRLIGVESHVLRYWEEELQITIRRTSQGHRIYSQENIALFRRVKELKEKGIQLKAIRVLLEAAGGAESSFVQEIREIEQKPDAQEEPSFEVVVEEKQETLRQFEQILKRMVGEVMEEQNERLERELAEIIREELDGMFVQIYKESAAAREQERGFRGLLRRYFGR